MNKWKTTAALICGGALVACGSTTGLDFEPTAFDPIPRLDALDWAAVQPAEAWAYWELREAGPSGDHDVLGSGGALDRDELDPATLDALDDARPPNGFAVGCLPGHCYKYVVATDGDEITLVDSTEELRAFLAPITSAEEAILLVASLPVVWWDDGENTGIRQAGSAWELVVFELARACTPVQTDRVLLRVEGATGAVTVRGRAVWERHEGVCI